MGSNEFDEFRRKLIRLVLRLFPEGLTAKEIAAHLGSEKSKVNSTLYKYPDTFIKDDDSLIWRLTTEEAAGEETYTGNDPVMLKLQNRERSKYCTQAEFDNLAPWDKGVAFIGTYIYRTRRGHVIECDSKSELKLLEYLEENNLVKDLGGQMLCIPYDTAFRQDVDYYPDIIALTRDDRIAIFEVKPVTAMDQHKNMEKYRSLAKYCEEHGYMYVMIDPASDFTTFEEVRDMAVCPALLDVFASLEEKAQKAEETDSPYAFFDDSDVAEWYAKYGEGYTKREFLLQVHSLVLYYEWYNFYTHGFQVYTRPVKLDKYQNVIEVG